jgi:hypothetical protein
MAPSNALRNSSLYLGLTPVVSIRRLDPFKDMSQSPEIYRFREKHVEAGVVPPVLVGGGKICADRDRRQTRPALPGLGNKVVAVAIGQANVAYDNVDGALVQNLQSSRSGIAGGNVVAPAAQNGGKSLPRIVMVFDKKDRAHPVKSFPINRQRLSGSAGLF